MVKRSIPAILTAMLAVSCGADSQHNAEVARQASTLDKIRQTGTITLGTREASIPFNYLDDDQEHAGFSWEIANRVVDAVKQELKLPDLAVKMMTVTPQTRIPLVANQTVDLECSSTTHNLEREQQVSFSNTFFIVGARLLVRKDSGIQDWPDVANKRVIVSSGTTAARLLRKLNSDKRWDIDILLAKDINENFMMVETGRAVASVQDDIILYSNIARARDPQAWEVVGAPLQREAYACMLRKGDAEFKRLVDDVIAGMMTSGEMARLYTKYFQTTINVRGGLSIDQPLSEDMRELFKDPNDHVL
jgi:glutamate/aspartate transport system substrate-binding protein